MNMHDFAFRQLMGDGKATGAGYHVGYAFGDGHAVYDVTHDAGPGNCTTAYADKEGNGHARGKGLEFVRITHHVVADTRCFRKLRRYPYAR